MPRPEATLRTARLEIRLPVVADADAIAAGLGDLAVSGMLAKVPHPYGRADAEAWIAGTRQHFTEGTSRSLTISLDGRAIGGVGLHDLPGGRPDLGYWLTRPQWGKGYASEAAEAVVAHAFGQLRVPEIVSHVFKGNDASLRVQEKLGFAITGRSEGYCLARGLALPNIDTLLTPERFRARSP